MSLALIEEGAKKSGILWVSLAGRDRLAWHVWHQGAIYLVTGGGEQSLPGLTGASRVRVTLRSKDNGAELVSFDADVEPVDQSAPSETETGAVAALVKERLNASGTAGLAGRWAASGASIVRLRPDVAV
ncbi:hypothetical protein [Sphaerisporangium dianthi]|uniref:Uncharacterized protein n=1 Tax=Sphaerisporangium dianthi TaxID=1436120 RepID=A0ABV9CHF2_9ACTN